MIARYALFEGTVQPDKVEAFQAAVLERLVPHWQNMPGNTEVSISFSVDRDEGAPVYPLILAVSYPDRETMEAALRSPARDACKAATDAVLEMYFKGRLHHHITVRSVFGR